jgi:hypothetical protein
VSTAERIDVPTGCVPSYRDFVRHLWRYQDERLGASLSAPPCMFRCIIESGGGELDLVQDLRAEVVVGYDLSPDCIKIELGADVHAVSFANLEALHLFVVHLAGMARYGTLARAFGDFMMWSLGFRWV